MYLTRVEASGLGPLKSVDLSFEDKNGIIALVGRNGRGKSTLVDSLTVGAWYGRLASHANHLLTDHLVGSNAFVRPTWHIDGKDYSFEVNAKNQGILRNGDGPCLAGPKISVYREAVAKLVPPMDVLLSSYVAAQKAGGFFKLQPSERYAVFAALLNLDRWETWSDSAKERAKELSLKQATIQAAADTAKARVERYTTLDGERMEVEQEALGLELRLPDLDVRITELDTQFAAMDSQNTKLQAEIDAHGRELKRLEAQLNVPKCEDDPKALVAEIETIEAAIVALEEELDNRTVPLQRLADDVTTRGTELAGKAEQARALRTEQITIVGDTAKTKRQLQGTVDGLTQVDLSIEMCQRCPLTAEGIKAHQAIEWAELECHRVSVKVNQELTPLEAEIMFHTSLHNKIVAEYTEQDLACQNLRTVISDQGKALSSLNARLAKATSVGGLSDEQRSALEAEAATVRASIAQMTTQKADTTPVRSELDSYREAHRLTQNAATAARQKLSGIDGEMRGLGDPVGDLATAVSELGGIESQLREWTLLKDGCIAVRKAEIANVGPIVSGIATEMLAGFDDGRFRIELETVLPKADGKGDRVRADFVPTVIDTFADERRSSVSGGEGEICDEAIRDAIAIWQAESAGVKMETISRDEVVGQLDSETAGHYIGMLRAMQQRAGCKQILLITHSEAVQRQCDHRLLFEDGTVRFAS